MSICSSVSRVSLPFECRSVSEFSGRHDGARFSSKLISKQQLFVRQLSNKADRRTIGIAQIVAASSSNYNQPPPHPSFSASVVEAVEFIKSKDKRRRFSFDHWRGWSDFVEEWISEFEGAESTLLLANGSGMCATSVMMLALVPAGGHIITTTDCYRKTRIFIETVLAQLGITVTVIDPTDYTGLESTLDNHKVSFFFTHSPTYPFLRCVDIELVSKLCHSKGALVCIDGTFVKPLNQFALALGADIVLHSTTKYIGGQDNVLAGSISGSTKIISRIRNLHPVLDGTISPYSAYLLSRGMTNLALWVQPQNYTAEMMAKILEAHPKACKVTLSIIYIAKKQMTGFGGVVCFEVDGDFETTQTFIGALKKIRFSAPSFGGCVSIVDQPAIMSYRDFSQSDRAKYGITDNLVRLSFGLEHYENLKADVLQALEMI